MAFIAGGTVMKRTLRSSLRDRASRYLQSRVPLLRTRSSHPPTAEDHPEVWVNPPISFIFSF